MRLFISELLPCVREFQEKHDARRLQDHSIGLNLTLHLVKQSVLCGVYNVRRNIKDRKVRLFLTKCSNHEKRPVL